MTQMNLSMKQKQIHRHRDETCGCQRGGGWGRDQWEFGVSRCRCKLFYIEWMKKGLTGLPWWHSGWESACQCRGHGFEPWSGKIPHATEQLGPWATTTEPAHLELVLLNKRGHDSERPAHVMKSGPRSPQLEKALAQKRRPNTAKNK